jgi:hypothetical protein
MKQVYLILAALMLLCLAPMPYGYFQLVRFVAMVAFGILAYQYYMKQKTVAAYTFGVLALLFQPMYKIALGRTIWNVVDVVVAVLLIALFVMEWRRSSKEYVKYQPVTPEDDSGKADDNRIEFQLKGKLDAKELVYVASEEDKTLTDLFETRPDVLEGWGQMIGFHIVYLPLLMRRLRDKRVLKYRAPYLSDVELKDAAIGNDFLLQYLGNPSDKDKMKQGLVRTEDIHRGDDGKDKAMNRFYPLSTTSGEPLADQLHRIGRQISIEKGRHDHYLEGPTGAEPDEESTDELMDEVKAKIAKLRQRGIAEYLLEQLIHPDNRLSRMVITKDWRIVLPDYNDMEIKMEPLAKAVYLLFLRHPEGIMFKHLPGYREELTQIYAQLRPAGMTDRAVQSIEDVTNPLLNSINEKCARIKGAFVGEFDDHMAKYYYISGKRGEAKAIALPRDLVVWE